MFALKSHCIMVDKWPKAVYNFRVMFNVVMFRTECEMRKNLLQHLSMVL